MVGRVTALVAVLDAGDDVLILRIGAEGLVDCSLALAQEGRIGGGDAGAGGERGGDVSPEDIEGLGATKAGDEVVEDLGGDLVEVEQTGLEMRSGAAVVADFQDEARRDLPLHGERPEGVLRSARGFLALPVVDVQAVREGRVERRGEDVGGQALVEAEGGLDALGVVLELILADEAGEVAGALHRGDAGE